LHSLNSNDTVSCCCGCCSHLGGFFLFLWLAVAGDVEWPTAAPAPWVMTTPANSSSWAAKNSSVRKRKILI
jgi:hypothetical protein